MAKETVRASMSPHRQSKARSTPRSPGYEQRREAIVQIAIDVFSRRGYVGGTTTEIAELAGLTQPALYHYVGGKSAFLEEICQRVGAYLREAMEQILATDLDPAARLREFVRAYCAVVLAEKAAFRIYVTEASHLPKRARNTLKMDERWYQQNVTELVTDAIAAGSLETNIDPWVVAQIILGASSWAYRWNSGQIRAEDFADSISSLIGLNTFDRDHCHE